MGYHECHFQTQGPILTFFTQIGIKINILEIPIYVCQFSENMGNFVFLSPNLSENEFWFAILKSKPRFAINTSNIPCEPILSQNGQLKVFRPTFVGNCPVTCDILVRILCILQRTGWRWIELGGGRWSWVEMGAEFSNAMIKGNLR